MRPPLPFAALAGALLALSGCSYASSYVPPADGRARMGWEDGKLTALLPAANTQLCTRDPAAPPGDAPPPAPVAARGTPAEEAPQEHHGAAVFVWIPYAPPPALYVGPAAGSASFGRVAATPHVGGGSSSFGSGSSGGGGGDKAFAAVVAVALLLAMPVISLSLAADPPGVNEEVASAIDQVNQRNDELRKAAAPCPGGAK